MLHWIIFGPLSNHIVHRVPHLASFAYHVKPLRGINFVDHWVPPKSKLRVSSK